MGHRAGSPGAASFRPENRPEFGGWVLLNGVGKVVGGPYLNEETANAARQAAITRANQKGKRP